MCYDKKVKLCKERPWRVRKNSAFLVDVKSLKNWKDVKDDMNGAYTRVLRCGVWTVDCDVLSADHVMVEIISKKVSHDNSLERQQGVSRSWGVNFRIPGC